MTPSDDPSLASLMTPALLLDRDRMRANIARMAGHIGGLGAVLRPHVKTHKCLEIARDVAAAGHARGLTVSTLREAENFFAAGHSDILYAVGISPNKFAPAAELIRRGCALQVILDTPEMAEKLADYAAANGVLFPVLIEIDTDGHRAGADPRGDDLLAIGRTLDASPATTLRGVMTHAGESYSCFTAEALAAMARQERDLSLAAAQRLRDAGLPCPVVSIGSTPTAFSIDDLSGITEVRAGVYVLFDLVMVGIGVCSAADIALSVLVTVTGHQRERGWIITDGGWMALSRDRGTASQPEDYGYGTVLHADGRPIPGLLMSDANQEHGILSRADGAVIDWERFPLGSQLRILPNHACSTTAQHDCYRVLEAGRPLQRWPMFRGW